jgi:hypothetical protein
MEPALAIKYPMIKSYAAQGIDDPTAVARFSVTQFGLHSMTLSAQKSTAYIDPYTTDTQNYIVYDRASLNRLPTISRVSPMKCRSNHCKKTVGRKPIVVGYRR